MLAPGDPVNQIPRPANAFSACVSMSDAGSHGTDSSMGWGRLVPTPMLGSVRESRVVCNTNPFALHRVFLEKFALESHPDLLKHPPTRNVSHIHSDSNIMQGNLVKSEINHCYNSFGPKAA